MKQYILSTFALSTFGILVSAPGWAEQSLYVAYPSANHKTTSDRIFLIGTASPNAEVLVNGQQIDRSPAGHFAPSFPLKIGENPFTLRHKNQEIILNITRLSNQPPQPQGIAFIPDTLQPTVDIAKRPGESICFSAIASPQAQVSVHFADQIIPLVSESSRVDLPGNKAVLTGTNQPISAHITTYQGCGTLSENPPFSPNQSKLELGQPQYQLTLDGKTITQMAKGNVSILSPTQFEAAEVIVNEGVARTGPSTTYSRLTPLPKGTRAHIIGREGDYIRLDYGGWIKAEETRIFTGSIPPQSVIRSVSSRQIEGWTEVYFPLQNSVPVSVKQNDRSLTLTLYNTIAQTDTIRFDDNPLVERMDWQPLVSPFLQEQQAVEYTFHLKSPQQWGYQLRYENTTLVLSLKHPPEVGQPFKSSLFANTLMPKPLSGLYILIDPGHGSENDLGARGPTGYPEKDVNLVVSYLLQKELIKRGARVFMTRKAEEDLYPKDRVDMIHEQKPDLALSIHYNALPDYGDAINTKGVGMFWYHPQAHSLAVFLHDYLVTQLNRPSYGVFWNNLALTRPAIAPSILLELGFMINPEEFEWIVNPQEQQKLASALADGIVEWMKTTQPIEE